MLPQSGCNTFLRGRRDSRQTYLVVCIWPLNQRKAEISFGATDRGSTSGRAD